MLLVDGAEYRVWSPSKEEDLESYVERFSKHIFGEESIYFSVKAKLRSFSGIGSIPDGYVVTLSRPHRWFVVEVELSTHKVFEHIVPQLNKFILGIRDSESRKGLVRALYDVINGDPVTEAMVKKRIGSGEVYRFLSDTLDDAPALVVVIDEKTGELEEALNGIPINVKHIVEFRTFERADVELRNVFLFNSLVEIPSGPIQKRNALPKGAITNQPEYAVPILESLVELGGSSKVKDVLDRIYEKMKDRLTPADLEKVPSGNDIRWKNHAKWERQSLKSEGYLKSGSPLGIWEITEKGKEYLKTKM